jgi:hypothetical protein
MDSSDQQLSSSISYAHTYSVKPTVAEVQRLENTYKQVIKLPYNKAITS